MEQIASARQNAPAVAPDATVVKIDADRARVTWRTFAGLNANFELAASWPGTVRFDNFSVTLEGRIPLDRIHEWIRAESLVDPTRLDQLPRWKFHECLPPKLQKESMLARLHDRASVEVARTLRIEYRDSA
jgi:hypothetical protein